MRKTAAKTSKEDVTKIETPSEQVAYDFFAPYYDHYMQHVDYDKWTDKLLSMYKLHTSHKLADILELACGTANVSERLVSKGYNVTASDRSGEMLKYASQKPHRPHILQADMTDELPENAYDLAVLIFDSINYLTEKEDIAKLFTNVSKSLRKHGAFIFDVSTYKNSQENFYNYINLDETKDYVLIHQATFDSDHREQRTKLIIFKKYDNHFVRMDEEHVQKVYYVQELLNLISESPLECVGIYSLVYDKNLLKTNSRKLDHQYSRLFFVLKKVGDA
jgi:SAM-dependent methyltransferase